MIFYCLIQKKRIFDLYILNMNYLQYEFFNQSEKQKNNEK